MVQKEDVFACSRKKRCTGNSSLLQHCACRPAWGQAEAQTHSSVVCLHKHRHTTVAVNEKRVSPRLPQKIRPVSRNEEKTPLKCAASVGVHEKYSRAAPALPHGKYRADPRKRAPDAMNVSAASLFRFQKKRRMQTAKYTAITGTPIITEIAVIAVFVFPSS